MYPIDYDAPRPEVPHSERIFAAMKELHEAYARDEPWTRSTPLPDASVLLVLTAVDDSVVLLVDEWGDQWKQGGGAEPFPDALDVRDEIARIVCKEAQEEYAAEQAGA